MRISLIDNGLDSLKKGYSHLAVYEKLVAASATDPDRFSALKDATLSIQHGVEILFKYCLKQSNEVLLFNDMAKLKSAFKNRRDGLIKELYEEEGIHTISFKESIERLIDICGFPIDARFKRKLLKVESWRNSITHSAVLLNEAEVSGVLGNLLYDLDAFFGPIIGGEYLEGQGRVELDRAYQLTKAVHGELENKVKAQTLQRLIQALRANNLKNIMSPGVFLVEDPRVAYSILQEIQGPELSYGCDLVNGHCSGKALVRELGSDNKLTIFTEDNDTYYQFALSSMVVYLPEINNDKSPLIFLYSDEVEAIGSTPLIRNDEQHRIQHGIVYDESRTFDWDKKTCEQSYRDYNSDEPVLKEHKEICNFLTAGLVCFLNVAQLDYGSAQRLLGNSRYDTPNTLYQEFKQLLEENK